MTRITVTDGQLEAKWIGPAPSEAPTLVFLHEGLGCVQMWREFPLLLAEATGCGALVYSRTGYGRSSPCALPRSLKYMHHEGHHVLPQVLTAMNVRQSILVGHSDGGSIALIYAGGTDAPSLLGVITLAAHVFCEDLSVDSIAGARRDFINGKLRERLAEYHGNNVDCAFWGWNRAWLDPGFRQWNIEEYLPTIRVPLLVLQGKQDQYGTEAQPRSIAQGAGAGAEMIMLDHCGHAPHRDQPGQTLQLMTQFIEKLRTGDATL